MLGYQPISEYAEGYCAVEIDINDCIGDLTGPIPVINASFGIYGDIEGSKATVDGTFLTVNYLNGDLSIPNPSINGTFATTALFVGDLDVPIASIDGTILHGNLLSGDLNVIIPIVSGIFSNVPADDWAANMDAPTPKIEGIIYSAIDDSAWAFSGDTICQP